MSTLNELYTKLSMRGRYEVWFLRLGLADGSGAWWFRYLLMNPGRRGCPNDPRGQPVQVWATWFPRQGKPNTWIQGFPINEVRLSQRGASPFSFEIGENRIGEDKCRGRVDVEGHRIAWDLHYRSSFRVELSSKGWLGFSRTPHSNAILSGEISFDGKSFRGEPLGYGMQGHNCGHRHRHSWAWTHMHFPNADTPGSSFEALVYEMPLGLEFRKAALWHQGREYTFRSLRVGVRDPERLIWNLECSDGQGAQVQVDVRGREGSVHRLPYVRTNCSGRFEVANDSLALSRIVLRLPGRSDEELSTDSGAVLEVVGDAVLKS